MLFYKLTILFLTTFSYINSSVLNEQCDLNTAIQFESQIKDIWKSWIITTAIKLNIAEHLRKHPMTIDELAVLTDTHAPSLFRLMRALSFYDIFKPTIDGKWTITENSIYLTSDKYCGLMHTALLVVQDEYLVWPHLYEAIKTGEPVFKKVFGVPYFTYLKGDHQKSVDFNSALSEVINVFYKRIPDVYNFKQFKRIIDLGGGDGTFMTYVLKSAPNATGAVFDEEYVIKEAVKNVGSSEVSNRCSLLSGSFFEFVPSGGDCYIIKNELHDWDDEHALKILLNVAKQMNSGTKLLIMNFILPENDEPHPSQVVDVYSLMMIGGKERTIKQYQALFQKVGLRLKDVISVGGIIPDIMEVVLDSNSSF